MPPSQGLLGAAPYGIGGALARQNIAPYLPWLAVTALVMLATSVLAALGPVRRALRINPTDALREV